MEVTECTKKKKEQKNCKTLVKGVLVLFLPCLWCHECALYTASMNLWICKAEWPKSPEHALLTEAVLRCRLLTERGEFHLQPFTGSLFVAPSCGASGEHNLECCPALFVLGTLAVTSHLPGRGHFLGFHVISATEGQNTLVHTYCTLVWALGKQWTKTVIFL